MHVISRFAFAMGMGGLLGVGIFVGCGTGQSEDDSIRTSALTLAACGLDDGTVDHDADVRACAPDQTHKTTICHIPPGNPGNAHTLCVGNRAVAAHLRNHGDFLGPCAVEAPCPPPSGAGGTGGTVPPSGGNTGAVTGGAPGNGGAVVTGGSSGTGAAGAGGQPDPIIVY